MTFALRTAVQSDAQSISDIYNYYVECSTCTFDVEREPVAKRIHWLRNHGPQHPVVVCVDGEMIAGWGSLSPWNTRSAYRRTAEVSFYVHHKWHRRGIGRLLLTELIDRGRRLGHHALIGGVCTEQLASIRLQEALGFVKVAHFKEVGHKFGRWLDVSYFQLLLDPHTCE